MKAKYKIGGQNEDVSEPPLFPLLAEFSPSLLGVPPPSPPPFPSSKDLSSTSSVG